ncbi:rolling circle replication-associated protein [Spiroplasma endosymbiont of Glossina fuscipes fuscipes]|uniref:rolling circle replication-associated protein n=1 Tax=Spiroplasma endosymbiont of Glossina fuscipes fuscipes TaxID=2004463 RepID=UPI003C7752AF
MNNVFIQDNLTNKGHNVIMNDLNYVKKEYYLKKVFYGNYVKNIVLPLELINNNPRNKTGIKNTGKNDKKLWNNRIRTQGNCIRKAYHNFSNSKNLSFLTLTYAVNEKDVKKCKNDLKLFFNNINRWWNNPIRSKHHKGILKYMYTYEYQKRGAVHFHIILNQKIPNSVVQQYWKYGINKNIKVRAGSNEDVVKYLAKYIVKTANNDKSQNHYDLNIKAYQFSKNCKNPRVKVGVVELSEQDLIYSVKDNLNYFAFGDENGYKIGFSCDSYYGLDKFREYKKYVSVDRKIFKNLVKNTNFTAKKSQNLRC